MAGQLRVYSFTHHIVTINGRDIENFGEGDDVVSTEQREDGVSDTVGADGKMQPISSANESAIIKIKLLGAAEENDYLEELYYKFKRGEIAGISVRIFNSITGKGEVATSGYIPRLASNSKGVKIQDREWSIIVPRIDIQKATQ